jgi:hypothetical protein
VIEPRIVKNPIAGSTNVSLSANSDPAMPAIDADRPNTTVFTIARLTPITAAAVSLSRTATIARPIRLRSRFEAISAHTRNAVSASQKFHLCRSARPSNGVHSGGRYDRFLMPTAPPVKSISFS